MDNFDRVSDAVRRRLESRSSVFQTLSEHGQFLIRMHLASHSIMFSFSFKRVGLFVRTRWAFPSNALGFSFERVWLLVWTCFLQRSNASRLWSECVVSRANTFGQKRVISLPDGYCIWCSSIVKLDNFELFINHQRYFSSFKLLRHCLHFAKILFNRRDYCTCAFNPRLCSDNRGFI